MLPDVFPQRKYTLLCGPVAHSGCLVGSNRVNEPLPNLAHLPRAMTTLPI